MGFQNRLKNLGGAEIVFVGGSVNLRTLNRNQNPNRIEIPRSHNCEQKTEVAAAHLATSPAGAGIRGKGEDGGYAVVAEFRFDSPFRRPDV